MEYGLIIALAVTALLAGAAWVGVRALRRRLQAFSRSLFGVNSLMKGLELQSRELADTPKSVSGMTGLFLPQIQRDFPQFNWNEFRSLAGNMLTSALLAISEKDAGRLPEGSPVLAEQVRLTIDDHINSGVTESYGSIHIHRTEITNYTKRQGTCVVTLQSAVEHVNYKLDKDGALISGFRDRLRQARYNMELLYVQDVSASDSVNGATGITCPNCGAPISSLGVKVCGYCGTETTEINMRVWSFGRFTEV